MRGGASRPHPGRVAAADTSYVASRRAWLVSEDPDLEDLRATHAFEQFEATCFPGGGPPAAMRQACRERAYAWRRLQHRLPRDGDASTMPEDGAASVAR